MRLKLAYIHGRLGPHIMHGRLAKSVAKDFYIVDKHKRWNDGNHSKLYLLYAWIYNALAFKNPKQYDGFLVSGPHFSPVIMKFLRLKSNQKIFVHLGDETMYFLYSGYYGKVMSFVLKFLLNQYDALLCEGQMAADLARLNGINKPKIYTTYLGIPAERQVVLNEIQANLDGKHLIFISTGPKGWRTYYKGIDLMINAYAKAFKKDPELQFSIIGEWDKELQHELLSNCSEECKASIDFVGQTNEIEKYIAKGAIYFHTARGDAFPTVVLEAMSAGLIPFLSEWTGSKELIEEIDSTLVVSLDEDKIADGLLNLINRSEEEKKLLSQQMKEISKKYSQEFAIQHYQKTFDNIEKELY